MMLFLKKIVSSLLFSSRTGRGIHFIGIHSNHVHPETEVGAGGC